MSEDITLTLEKREVLGKGVKQLRRDGLLPAVIHDHGKESIHVMGQATVLNKVYQSAGKHQPVHLTVSGKKYLAIIRDADFEPRKNNLQHLVFNAIKQDQKVETEIPIVFEGDAEAEKTGLLVLRQLESVQIEALPKDLPDEITVDISGLTEIGDKIVVGDLEAPVNVVILTEPEHPVATVDEPRAHAAAEAEDEAAEETAEGGEVDESAKGSTEDVSAKDDAQD